MTNIRLLSRMRFIASSYVDTSSSLSRFERTFSMARLRICTHASKSTLSKLTFFGINPSFKTILIISCPDADAGRYFSRNCNLPLSFRYRLVSSISFGGMGVKRILNREKLGSHFQRFQISLFHPRPHLHSH